MTLTVVAPVRLPSRSASLRELRARVAKQRPLGKNDEVVSAVEAAAIMGMTPQNVHHLIKTGRLRVRKEGRRWLVASEDVRAYEPISGGRSADAGAPS